MKITLKQLIANVAANLYKPLYISRSIACKLQEGMGLEEYDGVDGYIIEDCILYRIADDDVAIFRRSGDYLAIWHSYCDDGKGCLCKRGYCQHFMKDNIRNYQEQLESVYIDKSYQTPKFAQLMDDSVLDLS